MPLGDHKWRVGIFQLQGGRNDWLKVAFSGTALAIKTARRGVARDGPYFVSRAGRNLDVASIKDARLNDLKIGVHLIGSNGMNTPPSLALGQQNIVQNVVGYMIYGDYREPDPPARLMEAVEKGDIDIAAAWGPLAGYAAKISAVPLTVFPITETEDFAPLRFQFDIAMGVRKGDHALKARLDDLIARKQPEIRALLESYGVPLVQASSRAAETGIR